MSDDIKPGDPVEWSSSGGKSVGRVKKKLTQPMDIKGHHVAASPQNPELLVETEQGAQAAHKPSSLKKAASRQAPAKKPAAKKASTKKPSAKKPSAKKPSAKKPANKKPAAKKTAVKKSTAKKTATN